MLVQNAVQLWLEIYAWFTDMIHILQVLQLALVGVYALVALSTAAGWLPAGCFGALCLASPVVWACHALLLHR